MNQVTLERKMKTNGWLMWCTLILIIVIQLAAYDFKKIPSNTFSKVETIELDISNVVETLKSKTLAIDKLTAEITTLRQHIAVLEGNQKYMLDNQALLKKKLEIGGENEVDIVVDN